MSFFRHRDVIFNGNRSIFLYSMGYYINVETLFYYETSSGRKVKLGYLHYSSLTINCSRSVGNFFTSFPYREILPDLLTPLSHDVFCVSHRFVINGAPYYHCLESNFLFWLELNDDEWLNTNTERCFLSSCLFIEKRCVSLFVLDPFLSI